MTKWFFRSLMATMFWCCLVLPATAATTAARPVIQTSGVCLDVKRADPTPGTVVQVYKCNAMANQQWSLTDAGELRSLNNGVCLDVKSGTAETTPALVIYTCNGSATQKWRFSGSGSITAVQSGLCVDTVNGASKNSTPAQLATCRSTASQSWSWGAPVPPDTTPPTPPTSLSLSGLACKSATLSWKASTDNQSVMFYDVYHDGQFMTTVDGRTLSAVLTLTPGAKWGLYVNARDAAGNVSQASATLPVTVPQCNTDTQPPTVPTNLQGSIDGTTATLTWTASTDNVAVTAYDIYRNDAKIGSTATVGYTDTGLAPSTSYRYQVAARDAQNNTSARSVAVTLTTGAACTTPICSVREVAHDDDIPWGLVTLPDGNIIYSRRDAFDLVLLNSVTGAQSPVGAVPNVAGTVGEGGLLGLAVTPNFPATDPWLYIYHTTTSDNRIVRVQYRNGTIDTATLQVLMSGIRRNKYHNGGRLRFGPDGKLYATAGDAQNGAYAQDVNVPEGKVLRLNPDGTVPSDNPFGNYVWSYGHRNPQGLAFDSAGRLWEQEFGDAQQDETNLIVKGGNYGWPNCEGKVNRSGSGCSTPGYRAPMYTYPVANGSCSGIAIVKDALYVACLRGTRLYRHDVSSGTPTGTAQYFVGTYGRVRTVEPSRDGNLWLTTSNVGDKDGIPENSDEKLLKIVLGN